MLLEWSGTSSVFLGQVDQRVFIVMITCPCLGLSKCSRPKNA